MVWGIKAMFDESRQSEQAAKGKGILQQALQPRVLWGAGEELGCGISPSLEDRVVHALWQSLGMLTEDPSVQRKMRRKQSRDQQKA